MKFIPVSRRKNIRARRFFLQALGFACLTAAALPAARAQTTYTWDGGPGNWEDSARWDPTMTAPNSAAADVLIDGGKTATASVVTMTGSETVGRLTVDAGDTLNLGNNIDFTVTNGAFTGSGAIINNGTINFNSLGSGVYLHANGPLSLTGTGTINLNGGNDRIFANNAGDRITIGAGQTIAGTGNLGVGQTVFTNGGTISANQNGNALTLQPGGGNGNDFTNTATGVLQATGGGILQLSGVNGGAFTGGTIRAFDGSQVQLQNGANVHDTTLATAGTGTVNVTDAATLTNVTNTGALVASNNTTTTLVGTLTNNGTFNLNSLGNGDDLRLSGSVTLAGTGLITLSGANDRVFANVNGDRLTIGANQTIQGTGNLGVGQTVFTNSGTVSANQNGNPLVIQPGGGNGNDFTNNVGAVLQASNGGVLQLEGSSGGVFTNNGTIQALNGSQVLLNNGVTITGNSTFTTAGSGVITVNNSATLSNLTFSGALVASNNTTTTLVGTLTNNGTFNLNSLGNGDDLRLSGSVTLAGTGLITLSGANDRVFANVNGDRLTIGANQTIQGTGNLGVGQTVFTNSGTVSANQNGNPLAIQPGGGNGNDFTNNSGAVLQASNGGVLQLIGNSGGVFTNNGTIQALAGSQVLLSGGVTVTGNSTFTTTGSGVVTVSDAATFSNLTFSGNLQANNNSVTTLAGTLTNNGTFNLNSLGNGDDIHLSGSVTLAGTGVTNLNGANDRVFANVGGDRLTVAAGATLAGTGNLGSGQTTLTNGGLVTANQNGNTLALQPGGGNGNDFTNTGTGVARAENGGTLQLSGASGGVFTGNSFQALTGSQVSIGSNANVVSTTLATSGTGSVVLYDAATLTNVTNTGALVANNNSTTTLAGTLTNQGTFNLNSSGNGDDLRLSGSVTLAGTGVTNLNGANDRVFANVGGDRLTVAAGATLAGTGNLGSGQTVFTNNGTINANQSGNPLVIQPGGGNGNDFTTGATGVTEATGGGTLSLSGASGGVFTNDGVYTVNSGSAGGSSALAVDAGRLTNFSGATLTGGAYNVISSATANTSTLSFGGGTITTNAARVTLSGASTVFTEINGLNNNQGSFTVANGRNFTTTGNLTNSGTLVAAGGSTLTVNGGLVQTSTGTLTGNGSFTGAFQLAGNVNPGGTVDAATGAFADAAGATTLNGAAAFDVATQFHFELGSATGTNDHLNVNGALNLNGTVNVTALAGFGTGVYDLIDFPTLQLSGNLLTLGTLPSGYTYALLYLPGQVDLSVVQNVVPEPGAWAFVLGGATLLLGAQRLRRNARHGV